MEGTGEKKERGELRRKLTEEEGDKNRKEEREKTLSSTQYQ